jgi:hypothetical protein
MRQLVLKAGVRAPRILGGLLQLRGEVVEHMVRVRSCACGPARAILRMRSGGSLRRARRPFTVPERSIVRDPDDGPALMHLVLRTTSIDELPQLVNVLRGDMSIIGPRPHAVAPDDEYGKIIANYAFRHHVKPGIAGWAHVHGYRGETPHLDLMEKRVALDL